MRLKLSASVTRPNDTNTYTAGDVIGTAGTHILSLSVGEFGNLSNRQLYKANVISSASPALLASLELWLFNKAPAAQADHAAFAITDAEILFCLGVIPLTKSFIGLAGGNTMYSSDGTPIIWSSAPAAVVMNLYGILVVRNAYIPIANENFAVDVFGLE